MPDREYVIIRTVTIDAELRLICSTNNATIGSREQPGEPASIDLNEVEMEGGANITKYLSAEYFDELQDLAHEMWRDGK